MHGKGMTISEKILAAHAGLERVRAGEAVSITVDLVLERSGGAAAAECGRVRPGMTVLCDERSATGLGALGCSAAVAGRDALRAARLFGQATVRVPATVKCLLLGERPFGVGATDIALSILSRLGRESASDRALEFGGEVLAGLSIPARLSLCATAAAGGASSGIVPADGATFRYVCARATGSFVSYDSDPDARFDSVIEIDVAALEPMVALADAAHAVPASEVKPSPLTRAIVGPGALLEDLRLAAAMVRGRRVADGVEALLMPATAETLERARQEGTLDLLGAAGWRALDPAAPGTPVDGGAGRTEAGLTLASFPDAATLTRSGAARAGVGSVLTVAASALRGFVTDPRPLLPSRWAADAEPSRDDRRRQERLEGRGNVLAMFPGHDPHKELRRSIQP